MGMKGINNRQKTIVRPREDFQKYALLTGKIRKGMSPRKDRPPQKRDRPKDKGPT
jgi:hypothetical protein